MTKISVYALTLVIGLGTTAMLAVSNRSLKSNAGVETTLAADGAFRDGFYLGKLAAQDGRPARLAIGRWSTDRDRSMFTAGYRRGYSESVTNTALNAARAQSTE